jgi:hypothetical protein
VARPAFHLFPDTIARPILPASIRRIDAVLLRIFANCFDRSSDGCRVELLFFSIRPQKQNGRRAATVAFTLQAFLERVTLEPGAARFCGESEECNPAAMRMEVTTRIMLASPGFLSRQEPTFHSHPSFSDHLLSSYYSIAGVHSENSSTMKSVSLLESHVGIESRRQANKWQQDRQADVSTLWRKLSVLRS